MGITLLGEDEWSHNTFQGLCYIFCYYLLRGELEIVKKLIKKLTGEKISININLRPKAPTKRGRGARPQGDTGLARGVELLFQKSILTLFDDKIKL